MPIDINLIRTDRGGNPEVVKKSQRDRFKDETIVDQILEIDKKWREKRFELDRLNKDQREAS